MSESPLKTLNQKLQSVLYRPLFVLGIIFLLSSLVILSWSGFKAYPLTPIILLIIITIVLLLVGQSLLRRTITSCQHELETNRFSLKESHEDLQAQFTEQTRELKQSHRKYQELVESANSIILRWDTQGDIHFVNSFALTFFGFEENEILGKNVMRTIVPETESTGRDLAYMIEDIGKNPQDYIHNENENIKKDGSRVWVSWTNKAVLNDDGETTEILSIGNDITDKKIYEHQIYQLAHFDHLTGLPNRTLLVNHLTNAMMAAKQKEQFLPVFCIDLDRFKPINDSLGHHNGDLLLTQLSSRLSACLERNELIARMGGDEFTVILGPEPSRDKAFHAAQHAAGKMLEVMSAPYELNGHEIYITGSIGIVFYPLDGNEQLELLKNADTAMYQAKKQGKNCYLFYEPHMNSKAMECLKLETDLRNAINENGLNIHYQPTINIKTGKLECIEALLRWQHPTLGDIPPDVFIPVAEESGLIIQLGTWVLEQALKQSDDWRTAGHHDFVIAINISMRQFEHKKLLPAIEQILQNTQLPAKHLGLEITESTIMQDTEQGMKTLSQLNEMGVCLFIDDFGTGYSSLARLRDLPIHTVKIDKSFISDIATQPKNARIIDAIIAMAHNLNIHVIAEGVETREQLDYLIKRGCDCIQGNYLASAMPAEEIRELFSQTFHAHA